MCLDGGLSPIWADYFISVLDSTKVKHQQILLNWSTISFTNRFWFLLHFPRSDPVCSILIGCISFMFSNYFWVLVGYSIVCTKFKLPLYLLCLIPNQSNLINFLHFLFFVNFPRCLVYQTETNCQFQRTSSSSSRPEIFLKLHQDLFRDPWVTIKTCYFKYVFEPSVNFYNISFPDTLFFFLFFT